MLDLGRRTGVEMWYCAHVIMAVKLTAGNQKEFPVWENVLLLEADSGEAAEARATQIAREQEALLASSGMQYEGEPAREVFVGIRKTIEVSNSTDAPTGGLDGSEATYSQFVVHDEDSLMRLARGEPVSVLYEE